MKLLTLISLLLIFKNYITPITEVTNQDQRITCPNDSSGSFDLLDYIYQNYYHNLNAYNEQVTLMTDKDFYFAGENVSFFAQIQTNILDEPLKSNSCIAFLFNENKKVISYKRVYINKNSVIGSLTIPDSLKSSHVYLSLITSFTPKNPTFKKLLLITSEENDINKLKTKIEIKTNYEYLIPDQENELTFITSDTLGMKASIVTEDNELIKEFWLQNNSNINFTPSKNKIYFLHSGHKKLPLPKIRPVAKFEVIVNSDKIAFTINTADINTDNKILMICSGKELIWLSYIDHDNPKVDIPIDEFNSSLLFCFLLDKNLNLLYHKIISHNRTVQPIDYSNEKDTLILKIPPQVKGLSMLVSAVEANRQINRLKFSINELNELAYYGMTPSGVFFANANEKIQWLNDNFKITVEHLINDKKQSNENSLGKIVYNIPRNVKIDNKMQISAFDIMGEIINYNLQGHTIVIDPIEFDKEVSMLVLSANYKNKKIKLSKDSLSFVTNLERYLNEHFNDLKRYENLNNEIPFDYLNELRKLNDITLLNEVIVTGKRTKMQSYRGSLTIMFEELVLDDYTKTALNLVPQVGLYSKPNYIIEKYDFNKDKIIELNGQISGANHNNNFGFNSSPIWLNIYGPSGMYYSGKNFFKLNEYPAEWVYSITRTNTFPESLTVFIIPFLREKEKFISYEKIFSQYQPNDNSGVLFWDFIANEKVDDVKIPLKNSQSPINLSLQYFDKNGKILGFNGFFEPTLSE